MEKQKENHPYLGVPGVQMINAKFIRVDMLHLKIAEKDLAEGRPSVTPYAPVEVEYNIDSKSFRLKDGYHRYLEKRGGSVDAALQQSRQGTFPDFAVNVSLVKTLNRAPFGDYSEPLTADEEQIYLADLYDDERRLYRAAEQGFDINTVWYHGSVPAYGEESADFHAFDKACVGQNYNQDANGFFFISDPVVASIYATSNAIGKTVTGGCVYPVYLACDRVFRVDDAKALAHQWAKPSVEGVIGVWDLHHQAIMQAAFKAGSDSVEVLDKKLGQRMMVVFEPNQIRSVNASFLPEHRHRPQLLGHDFMIPPAQPKPPEPIPKHLVEIASAIEAIFHAEPIWNSPDVTKQLLSVVGGSDWEREDKLSLFHVLHQSFVGKLPIKERAACIAKIVDGIINRRAEALQQPAELPRSPGVVRRG